MALLAAGLFVAQSAEAACSKPSSGADLDAAAAELEQAVVRMDVEAIAAAGERSRELVECLDVPATRAMAATALRTRGLALYYGGDARAAEPYLGVARALEPAYSLPSTLAPGPEHPLRRMYDASLFERGDAPLKHDRKVEVRVNGEPSSHLPLAAPYVLQYLVDASVVTSALVASASPPPAPPGADDVTSRKDGPLWLPIAGGGALVAGLGLATISFAGAGGLCRIDTDGDLHPDSCESEEEKSRYDRLRALNLAGIGLAVVGAGATTVGIALNLSPTPGASVASLDVRAAW